jgi:hypothetical protein
MVNGVWCRVQSSEAGSWVQCRVLGTVSRVQFARFIFQGADSRVEVSGCRLRGAGMMQGAAGGMCGVEGAVCGVQAAEYSVQSAECRVKGKMQGAECRVQG